jgi:hypothetical protein
MTLDVEPSLTPIVEAGHCPHLAMLLASYDQVAPALASFYALGAKRNGWMFHRSLPGRAAEDRGALGVAGLDVDGLEAGGRLTVDELPLELAPRAWARPWLRVLDERLAGGFDAAWWSPFPIGPDPIPFEHALAYDRAWEASFHGRPAVTLCLYVVGSVEETIGDGRFASLAAVHDALLVPEDDHVRLVRTRGEPGFEPA